MFKYPASPHPPFSQDKSTLYYGTILTRNQSLFVNYRKSFSLIPRTSPGSCKVDSESIRSKGKQHDEHQANGLCLTCEIEIATRHLCNVEKPISFDFLT